MTPGRGLTALADGRSLPTFTVMTALLPVAGGTVSGTASAAGSTALVSGWVEEVGGSVVVVVSATFGSSAANGVPPTVPSRCTTESATTWPDTSASISTGAVGASRLPASGWATTTAFASTTFHTMSARAAASTVTGRSRSTFPPSPSTLMTSGRCSVGAGSMVMLPIWARSAAWTDQTLGPSPSPAARCTSARGSPALAMAPPSAAVGVNVGFSLASVRPRAARSAKTPPKARSNVPGEETVCGSCGPLARSWGSAATSAPAGSTATPPSTAAVWAAPTLPMSRRASSPTVSRPAELPSPTEPPTSRPMGVSSSCAGGVGVTV